MLHAGDTLTAAAVMPSGLEDGRAQIRGRARTLLNRRGSVRLVQQFAGRDSRKSNLRPVSALCAAGTLLSVKKSRFGDQPVTARSDDCTWRDLRICSFASAGIRIGPDSAELQ
jgi:hypothetical protein